jgi:hypothetical protein
LQLPILKHFKFLNLPILKRNSWEWLEGRFFAHEFILRHMLANHTHYIFPFIRRAPVSTPPTAESESGGSPNSDKYTKSFAESLQAMGTSPQRALRRSASEDFTSNTRKKSIGGQLSRSPNSPKSQGATSIINQLIANAIKPFPLYEIDLTAIEVRIFENSFLFAVS